MAKYPDEVIVSVLLGAGSVAAAADQLGVSVKTIRNRMQNSDFMEKYNDAKIDVLRNTVSELSSAVSSAVWTVREIMEDRDNNPQTRLQAAQTILNTSVKLSDRLAQCEKTRTTDDWMT